MQSEENTFSFTGMFCLNALGYTIPCRHHLRNHLEVYCLAKKHVSNRSGRSSALEPATIAGWKRESDKSIWVIL